MQKIRIIGAGIKLLQHLTIGAIENLKNSKKVLYFPTVIGETEKFLTRLNVENFENLEPLYKDGSIDADNYRRTIDKILAELRIHGDVAFLLAGHPRFGVTTLKWLENEINPNEIELSVVEGVSSFDTMVNDLKRDPLDIGTVIMDANRLLQHRYAIDSKFDHYIYHICSVGTANTNFTDPSRDNKINELLDILLDTFSSEHPCYIIESSVHNKLSSRVIKYKLQDLIKSIEHINFGTTLFIPSILSNNI